MQLAFTAHLPFRLRHAAAPEPREERVRVAKSPTQLARRAAACEDRAYYACACGFAFTAVVSTTVGCPQCGAGQAW